MMFMFLHFFLFLFSFVACAPDIPREIQKCHRSDPKIAECLLKATESARPFVIKGVPDLRIPPLTSYFLPVVRVRTVTSQWDVSTNFTNVTLSNLEKYKFENLNFDSKALVLSGALALDALDFEARYVTNSKLMGVPIEGKGPCKFVFLNLRFAFEQSSTLAQVDNVDFLDFESIKVKTKVEDFTLTYSGLFEGLPRLAKLADAAVVEFHAQILEMFEPVIEGVVAEVIELELVKKLLKLPYDTLFPV